MAANGFDRVDIRVGQSASRNFGGYLNGGYRLNGGYEIYVGGGASYRTGRGSGFNRLPNQPTQSDLNIYPNGFLPFINTTIYDQSAITGIRKSFGGFDVDVSNTFGRNELAYRVDGSINASLPQSPSLVGLNPTSFYAGRLAFLQNTTNLGFVRKFRDLGPLATLNVAFGGEFRVDNFQIGRGEYASYINGGRLYNNAPTASGSQVFPGY